MAKVKKDRRGKARSAVRVSPNQVYYAFKRALNLQNGLTRTQIDKCMLPAYLALDNLAKGAGDEAKCIDLVAAVTVGIIFAENGIGVEFVEDLNAALESLWRMKRMYKKMGVWGFDAAGIESVRTALDLYEQQLSIASNELIERSIDEARIRVCSDDNYKDIEYFEAGVA
jgi:hypothetical protein